MAPKTHSSACIPRFELRSKECVDNVLKPLIDHIEIPINGSLSCKDIFHTTISMAVDKNSETFYFILVPHKLSANHIQIA
jgi:putative transposase